MKLNEAIGIGRVMFNSLFVVTVYTLLSLLICTMAGYAFAKFHFMGPNLLFGIFLLSMMVPITRSLFPCSKSRRTGVGLTIRH